MSEQASGNFISVSERLKRFKPDSGRRTVKHYPTGIRKLDQMLGGGLYAGLTFLGARPGMGKSTFALQILSSCTGNRNATERQKNDENINVLSSLSNKYDLSVFVISSLNRESYRDEQRPLRMDSFKETGGIEYSASVILGLQPRNIRQPKCNYEQEMSKEIRELEIVFLKQRYGVTGMKANVSVDFHAAKDLYMEKGAQEKKSAQNVSRETKTDKKSIDILQKKHGSDPDLSEKSSENIPKNAKMKDTEAESTYTQNTSLGYPDDPRERLAEEFRRLL